MQKSAARSTTDENHGLARPAKSRRIRATLASIFST
jgi:hypothetical protein